MRKDRIAYRELRIELLRLVIPVKTGIQKYASRIATQLRSIRDTHHVLRAYPVHNLLASSALLLGALITPFSFAHLPVGFALTLLGFTVLFLSFVAFNLSIFTSVNQVLSTVSTGPIINTAILLKQLVNKLSLEHSSQVLREKRTEPYKHTVRRASQRKLVKDAKSSKRAACFAGWQFAAARGY